jgi:hypothetical protein
MPRIWRESTHGGVPGDSGKPTVYLQGVALYSGSDLIQACIADLRPLEKRREDLADETQEDGDHKHVTVEAPFQPEGSI